MRDKKDIKITNAFQKNLDESECHNPNKIWVDKGSGFCNKSMKPWLKDNNIEMYSSHNEKKSVVAERFIKPLKNEIYKYIVIIIELTNIFLR